MALNSTPYPNISRVVSGAAILSPNDSILLCNTSTAPVTMTLLEIPPNNWQTTWKLYVLDNSNNAAAQNITITAPSGYTINNASTLVINTNGGGVTITIASNTAFFGQVSPLPSGGGGSVTNVTATSPMASTLGSTPNLSMPQATGGQDGFLAGSDYTTFSSKISSVTGTAPVSVTGGVTPVVSMAAASGSVDGYLTQGSFTTFTDKSEKVIVSNTAGAVVTPTCTNIEFKTTDFTTTNPVSGKALVELVQLPMMLAQETPTALPIVAVALANTMFTSGVIQLINEVYDDNNDYDPATGIWTCPTTGRYNLNCYAHYTNGVGTGWFDSASATITPPLVSPVTITNGMFSVAVMSATANSQYCGNWISPSQTLKHIDITATATGMEITAGVQLCVKVLNQTSVTYAPVVGDVIRFAIQRITNVG